MVTTILYRMNEPATILAQNVLFIDHPGLDTAELRIDSGECISERCGQLHVNQSEGPTILHLQWDKIPTGIFPVNITKRTLVESRQ